MRNFTIILASFFYISIAYSQCEPPGDIPVGAFASMPHNGNWTAQAVQDSGGCYTVAVSDLPLCYCFDYTIPDPSDGQTDAIINIHCTDNPYSGATNQTSFDGSPPSETCGISLSGGGWIPASPYVSEQNVYDSNGNLVHADCAFAYGSDYAPGQVLTTCLELVDPGTCSDSITICVGCNGPAISPCPANAGSDVDICEGEGPVTLTASGGSSYEWSNGDTGASISVSPTSTTTYTVTVDGDNTCTDDVIVTINAQEDASFSLSDYCEGNSNSATITGTTGGVFTFNPIPNNGETINSSTGEITGGVGGTTYTVQYTTIGVCPDSSTQNVTVNPFPTPNITGSLTFCSGSSITLDAGSGYTNYTWDPNGETSQTINVTTEGTFSVTVTTSNGCSGTDQVTTSFANGLSPTITGVLSICSGASTILDAGSGYANYTWTPNGETSQTINVTSAGTYIVSVSDASGCSGTDTVTVTEHTSPTPIISGANFCEGNSTTLDAGAGYTNYTWSPNGETTQTINVTSGGNYNVLVVDSFGCSGTDQITITEYSNPTPVILGNNFCVGDSTILDAGSGYQSYSWSPIGNNTQTIMITGGGNYQVEVTDANGCIGTDNIDIVTNPIPTINAGQDQDICLGNSANLNATSNQSSVVFVWSNSLGTGASQTVTPTSTTSYYVSVDANGCTNSDTVTVYVHSNPITSLVPSNVTCNGANDGSIDLTVINGTPPYSYNWSNGDNTEDISDLTASTYTVTVEDSFYCNDTNSTQITEPDAINASLSASNADCYSDNNNTINLTVNGGVFPYAFIWNNGSTTQNLNSIPAGNYTVTVTDANSCTQIESIIVTEPNKLVVSLPEDFTFCNQDNNLIPSVEGGTLPYSYLWNDNSTNQNNTFDTLQSATYSLTVTDNNGCTANDIVNITIPDVSITAYSNLDTVCPGNPVIITTNIVGQMPPYTVYENGQTVNFPLVIYPNNTQNYNIQVVDACGNTDNVILDIYTYPIPPLSFSADILKGCPPLVVNFNQTSYNNNYIYNWNFDDIDENNYSSAINPTHIFTESGLYDISLQVIDNNGCNNQLTISDMIEVYPKPEAHFVINPEVTSFINSTINFTNYSVNNYNNFWFFDDGEQSLLINPTHTYANVGFYYPMLVVENNYGCLDTAIHKVEIQDEFTLYVPTAFSPDNDGINDGFRAVGHGIDLDNYFIAVYDRWGEIIWSSTDLFETWDGTAKDGTETVQNGVYKWLVICRNFRGIEYTKSGNVTVIR